MKNPIVKSEDSNLLKKEEIKASEAESDKKAEEALAKIKALASQESIEKSLDMKVLEEMENNYNNTQEQEGGRWEKEKKLVKKAIIAIVGAAIISGAIPAYASDWKSGVPPREDAAYFMDNRTTYEKIHGHPESEEDMAGTNEFIAKGKFVPDLDVGINENGAHFNIKIPLFKKSWKSLTNIGKAFKNEFTTLNGVVNLIQNSSFGDNPKKIANRFNPETNRYVQDNIKKINNQAYQNDKDSVKEDL